jgi:hypothetical protein
MAQVPFLGYEEHSHNELQFLRDEAKALLKHPEAREDIAKAHKILSDIVSLAGCTTKKIGESEAWNRVARHAKADRVNLCRVLEGKSPFGALYAFYTLNLTELKAVLQHSAVKKGSRAAATATATAAAANVTTTAAAAPALLRMKSTSGSRKGGEGQVFMK